MVGCLRQASVTFGPVATSLASADMVGFYLHSWLGLTQVLIWLERILVRGVGKAAGLLALDRALWHRLECSWVVERAVVLLDGDGVGRWSGALVACGEESSAPLFERRLGGPALDEATGSLLVNLIDAHHGQAALVVIGLS